MSHGIAFSEWSRQWLDRSLPGLLDENAIFLIAHLAVIAAVGIYTLARNEQCRRAIKRNPSDSRAAWAKCDKICLIWTRAIFFGGCLLVVHALAIWVIDASIGVFAIAEDVTSNPEAYTAQLWLDLAIHSVAMLAIFTAVFILFPAAQMTLAGYLLARSLKNNPERTLAVYIPAARLLIFFPIHIWSSLSFFIVVGWPVFEVTTIRLIVLEAVFGSALAWLHASFILNFRAHQLEHVVVQPLLTIRDGIKMYGQQVYAVHSGKGGEGLPLHETAAQTEPLLSEKN